LFKINNDEIFTHVSIIFLIQNSSILCRKINFYFKFLTESLISFLSACVIY